MGDGTDELFGVYPPLSDIDVDVHAPPLPLVKVEAEPDQLFTSPHLGLDDIHHFGEDSDVPMQCLPPYSDPLHHTDALNTEQLPSPIQRAPQTPATTSEVKPRKKQWQCVYPGCQEPPKTHYNCHSHVWDAHVRHQLPPDHPLASLVYKKLPDRNVVKSLCRVYMVELEDNDPSRKRRKRSPTKEQQQQQQQQQKLQSQPAVIPLGIDALAPNSDVNKGTSEEDDDDDDNDAGVRPPGKKRPPPSLESSSPSAPSPSVASQDMQVVPVTGGVKIENPSYSLDPGDVARIIEMSPELKRLHVCGEVFSERGFLQRSDARFKEDIAPISGALERVLQMTGKTFRYKGDSTVKMGFIAQELEDVVPTAVFRDDRGLSVDVVSLVPLLLEALKDLYEKTRVGESDQLKQLNSAIDEAMQKVSELDKKFEQFRVSESEDNSDDDVVFEEVYPRKRSGDRRDSSEMYDDRKKQDDGKDKNVDPNRFHYKFSFGPSLIVFVFALITTASGFVTWYLMPSMPFVWIYAWILGAALTLSLLQQIPEIKSLFTEHVVSFYWTTSNSINWYCAVVVGLIGATTTLVLGMESIYLVSALIIVLFVLCIFSLVVHLKYHVRVQSLFVVFVGFLALSLFFFAIFHMSHPFTCSFEGYTTPRVNVPVRVGQEIQHISLTEIPWNCFSPQVLLSSALPHNITLHKDDSKWYFAGRIETLFNPSPVDVTLECSGVQRFSCGTLTFLPCADYVNESECKSNLCSWCSSLAGGYCGFCTDEFEMKCYNSTGTHSSCFTNGVKAGQSTVLFQQEESGCHPLPGPLLLIAFPVILLYIAQSVTF